ncbi:Amidohydrolase 2 (plasmid) [Rhodococcus sp. WAY2]|nr:Amidohydrolase 2 [Rhodococcus sp. WAY2]
MKQERQFKIFSVDDHLCEPPDMFEGRFPAKLQDRAPKVITKPDGAQAWVYDDKVFPNIAVNAIAGLPKEKWNAEPVRFDEIRKGTWDIHARIEDMDVAGIAASVCFPSQIAGFGGVVFADTKDPEVGLASVRAWNDWHHEVWAGTYPGRIVPLQLPWLPDPKIAAEEIRRNAARGFRAVTFPEYPINVGYPSLQETRHWDPFFAACEETETVVCIHAGSGRWVPRPVNDGSKQIQVSLFPVNLLVACTELLWSGILSRFPNLKVSLAEGGFGWVPVMLDRLRYMEGRASDLWDNDWKDELSPAERLLNNFYFCSLDDRSTMINRHQIGVDHIMIETDYPHADSTWPDCQEVVAECFAGVPDDEVELMTYRNAERLFRFPLAP